MGNKSSEIKVISNIPCSIEAAEAFNKRIAEVILMKFPKKVVEEMLREYEELRKS